MIFKKAFAITLLIFAVCSCSERPNCMIADSVQEIVNKPLNERGLHLYLRTSGFGEKEHFYELFKGTPSFNECGMTTADVLSQAHIDTSLGIPEKLKIDNNQIEVLYKLGKSGSQLNNIVIVSD